MGLVDTLLGWGIVVIALILVLMIAGLIFWLVMFIDALNQRDSLWIFLFIFSFFTGFLSGLMATLYYFLVYRKHK